MARLTESVLRKIIKEELNKIDQVWKKENFDLDNQNTLQISLTREELANMVGTATESVIRLLSEFKQDKLIELQGRKIKFLDIANLRRVANI